MSQSTGAQPILGSMRSTSEKAVFYCMRNVFIYPDGEEGQGIPGHLTLVAGAKGATSPTRYLAWTPDFKLAEAASAAGPAGVEPSKIAELSQIRVPLADLQAIKRRMSRASAAASLVVTVQGGVAFPPFYFLEGGVEQLLAVLQQLVPIFRSTQDSDLFLLNCSSTAPRVSNYSLSMSHSQPHSQLLSPSPSVSMSLPSQSFGTNAQQQQQQQQHTHNVSHSSSQQTHPKNQASQQTQSQSCAHNQSSAHHAPPDLKAAAWGLFEGMQKVGKLAKDATSNLWQYPDGTTAQPFPGAPPSNRTRAEPEDTALGSFEVVTELPSDARLEQVRLTVQPRRLEGRVGAGEWISFFDSRGRLRDPRRVRERIYRGGLEAGVRSEAWKYLLGYYPFDSTLEQRETLVKRKEVEYRIYQTQWQSITEEQERHHAKFRSLKERIEKDVVRTDRTWPFFEADDSPHLQQLHRILLTYSFFNFDIGYVQGMNDLVSVLLIVMHGNELEAYWCFKGLMDRMMDNFKKDQIGIHSQLTQLARIVQYLDPPLYAHLVARRATNMFFCFRWVLILFKREFPLPDVQRIWEIIWADFFGSHHHLFVCLAMLEASRGPILEEDLEFDEILRHMNEQSMKMDATHILEQADVLYRRFILLCDEEDQKKIFNMKASPDMGKR